MYSIADRQQQTKRDVISFTIEAPLIARKTVPGQFVVVRVIESGEREPLTAACEDVAGTITIILRVVDRSTAVLASLCDRERPGAAGSYDGGADGGPERGARWLVNRRTGA